MANIKSAKKRILVIETKTARNKAIKSKVKTYVKKVDRSYRKQLWIFETVEIEIQKRQPLTVWLPLYICIYKYFSLKIKQVR